MAFVVRSGWLGLCVAFRGKCGRVYACAFAYREAVSLGHKKAMADFRENAFLLDFENWCLQHCWHGEIPKGPGRIENPEWAAMMRKECEESDTTFERYCEWVHLGGGDEWFQS